MSTFTPTTEQQAAIDQLLLTITNSPQFVLCGYAGTGKTSVISHVIQTHFADSKVAICAPTGKAANVLRTKGLLSAQTLHSLIYRPIIDPETKEVVGYEKKPSSDLSYDYIICDESSMVNKDVYNDLMSFSIPVIFLGDSGQLEAIGDDAKILHSPNVTLQEVHRQALDNPIIELATNIRTKNQLKCMQGKNVTFFNKYVHKKHLEDLYVSGEIDQIICGFNKTRRSLNQNIRFRLNFNIRNIINENEKIICLKNDTSLNIFNGQTLIVQKILSGNKLLCCDADTFEDIEKPIPFNPITFGAETIPKTKRELQGAIPLDYAYAITCHKSQGSEWANVAVVDEAFGDFPQRWRYTAITRAKTKLLYFC